MVRFAVVGAGSVGREYALRYLSSPAISAEGDIDICNRQGDSTVVAIIDSRQEAAEDLAKDVSLRRAGAALIGDKYRETADIASLKQSEIDLAPHVLI